ncbi:histidine phosphatase family protein [bacterium]|nr:histidine phosphatase family protein [bacterium]
MPDIVFNLKSLTFVRHSYPVPAGEFPGSDLDRPLSEKGVEAAKALNEALAATLAETDVVLISDALRVAQTLKHLTNLSKKAEVRVVKALYDCSAGQLYNIILENQQGVGHLLVIGHNPSLSQLYSMLSGDFTALSPAQSRTLVMKP